VSEVSYEEWVPVCYGTDLKYIGRVIDEGADTMTIRFLEKSQQTAALKLKGDTKRWRRGWCS